MHISFVPSRSVQAPFFDTICFKGTWAAFPLWGNKECLDAGCMYFRSTFSKGGPFWGPQNWFDILQSKVRGL